MSLHHTVRKDHQKFAERHVRRAKGGKVHADEAEDKKLIKKELEEARIKPKRKRGGHVHGKAPHERLDKRARGGRTGGKHGVKVIIHAGGGGQQQAAMAHQAGIQQGMRAGAALGARAAAQKMAGGPPGGPGGPPPGGPGGPMPTQAMPGPRPMANGPMPGALKSGGAVDADGMGKAEHVKRNRGGHIHDTESVRGEKAGSRSGEGRYEKEGLALPKAAKGGRVHVKEHTRRARGGATA